MIKVSFDPGGARRGARIDEEIRFAARPLVRGLVAAALARAEGRRGRAFAGDGIFEAGSRIDVEIDGEQLIETIRAAAVDGLQRFLDGLEEGLRAMEEPAETPAPKSRRKPKSKAKAKAKAKPAGKRRARSTGAAA